MWCPKNDGIMDMQVLENILLFIIARPDSRKTPLMRDSILYVHKTGSKTVLKYDWSIIVFILYLF